MKKEIKTYIFDFGDVFINLDKPATLRELSNLGKSDFNDEMLKMNKLYEKGMVSTDDFLQFYQSQFPQASKQQLADAWNSIILDFPAYRLQFLEDFSQTHQCYLLSNINDLHLTYIKANLDEAFYKRFINCFDKVYYSHKIHLRKPDAEIYKFVLNDAGLQADESLFIDDTLDNIQAAQQAGLQVWHLLPEEDVVDIFEK